jgi:hypothetical protein
MGFAVSNNYVGLDELEGDPHREDYVELRTLEKTEGYLGRLAGWR